VARIHVATPNAKPMDLAMIEAFARWNCEPLGVGSSADGWSKMAEFQRCPYRYWLRHEAGAIYSAGPEPAPLQIGGLWHAAVACHYCRMLEKGMPGWRATPPPPIDFIDAVEEAGAELAYVEEARRMFYGYQEHHGVNDPLRPLAIEMGAGIQGVHTSRFDMVASEERLGGIWIVEHKTAFAETAEVIEGWYLDGEIIGECYSWRLSGLDKVFGPLMGVIVNLGIKARPPTFRRLEVPIPESVMQDYIRDRAHWGAVREHYRKIGYWPRKLQGCKGPMGKDDLCAYRLHCRESNPMLLQIRGSEK
jgi:hypothetical protein